MDKKLVEIVIVADRSGSMSSIRDDAQGGFNSFIKKMKTSIKNKKVKISLAQFDDKYELLWDGIDIKDAPDYILEPRGMTALLDAMGKTINDVGIRLSKISEKERPSRIIFVTLTDGQENSSKEFTFDKIKEMIAHQESKYSWEFMFLSSDLGAMDQANKYSFAGTTGCSIQITTTGGFRGISGYSGVKGLTGSYAVMGDSLTHAINTNSTAKIYNKDEIEE
jgi:hypothetical protein